MWSISLNRDIDVVPGSAIGKPVFPIVALHQFSSCPFLSIAEVSRDSETELHRLPLRINVDSYSTPPLMRGLVLVLAKAIFLALTPGMASGQPEQAEQLTMATNRQGRKGV